MTRRSYCLHVGNYVAMHSPQAWVASSSSRLPGLWLSTPIRSAYASPCMQLGMDTLSRSWSPNKQQNERESIKSMAHDHDDTQHSRDLPPLHHARAWPFLRLRARSYVVLFRLTMILRLFWGSCILAGSWQAKEATRAARTGSRTPTTSAMSRTTTARAPAAARVRARTAAHSLATKHSNS